MAGTVNAPITIDAITRYSTVQLTAPVSIALFHFHLPADAELVTKFSHRRRSGLDMTGQFAPDVQLVAANGASVPLSSYRGKPVLLDFWATWCQPCVESFPKLAELEKETAPKGSVLLGVDEDKKTRRRPTSSRSTTTPGPTRTTTAASTRPSTDSGFHSLF